MINEMNEAEGAIKQVIEKFTNAWNVHDVKAFSLLFTGDADFTNVFGLKSHGRKSIEDFHAPLFTGMFKASEFTANETEIRLLNEYLAAVDVSWNMSGATDPKGNPWPDRKGLMNLIMKYENEAWLILIMHNMDMPVLPPP